MTDKNFMRVEDVARELDVSKSYAYKLMYPSPMHIK